ncbi:PIN domain-containing protein [Pseudoalteromonas sp. Ld20]|uniref:PIN domain-containing protein n=1 Tax=Pseudoalteromonas sp. Ld20 TaxID=649165 RepID=UPI0038634DAE
MSDTLKTRHVFVDTQVFVRHGIQLERSALKRLRELASWRMINLVLTDVVVKEVETKIREKTKNARLALNKFIKESDLISVKISDAISFINEVLNEDVLDSHGKRVWTDYVSTSRASVLSSSVVDTSVLLSKYFDESPPFSAKKKDEFPDAISFLSLESWAKDHKEGIYIVSGDGDAEEWCKNNKGFYYLKSLNDFIDLYNKTEEKLTYLVHEIFETEKEWLLSIIEEEFKECEFSFRPDVGAHVENVNVTEIQNLELSVIEIDEERALLSISMHIDFTADVSGEDYDSAIWDSEDKEYIYIPSYSSTVEEGEFFDVTIEVYMDISDKSFTRTNALMFDDSRTIEFGHDEWPYK